MMASKHPQLTTKDISTFSVRNQLQLIMSVYQLVSRDAENSELKPLRARMFELLNVEYPDGVEHDVADEGGLEGSSSEVV